MYQIIKKLCESNSISIFSLEKKLGFGNGTISRWDNSSPTVANLKKVADYFGVTIEELLSQEELKEEKVG
ncbi:MAG: helix-turn-helix domain-containing protein [Lachnoanaerobaculum saburreum]